MSEKKPRAENKEAPPKSEMKPVTKNTVQQLGKTAVKGAKK
jgi:hypothetical protein